MRKTIMNQRKIMEQLQQQFAEALTKPDEEEIKPLEWDGEATNGNQGLAGLDGLKKLNPKPDRCLCWQTLVARASGS